MLSVQNNLANIWNNLPEQNIPIIGSVRYFRYVIKQIDKLGPQTIRPITPRRPDSPRPPISRVNINPPMGSRRDEIARLNAVRSNDPATRPNSPS